MIARLAGIVVATEDTAVILDVGGVGYRVAVLGALRSRLKLDQSLTLLTHHHVSDSNEDLYGFLTAQDLQYFKLLLTVPSVGPRTAMNILDLVPPHTLAQAVAEDDMKLLTRVSGVGRKTAERIIVELKEKIPAPARRSASGDVQEQTISALVNLGFTKAQARELTVKLPKSVHTVEDAVRHSLKRQD